MKQIIYKKVIIELNDDGTFKNGIVQYKINADGVIAGISNTLGVDSIFQNTEAAQGIMEDIKQLTEQAEGITQ